MLKKLMVALVLVASTVTGGIAAVGMVSHIAASDVPAPTGTPTPTHHGQV